MQRDQQYFPQNPGLCPADQVGSGYITNPPISSFFGQNVDFQPSKICPRNFLIFDRTDNHSQIMYNPATAPNFGYAGLNAGVPYFHDNVPVPNDVNDLREVSSFMKEDSADIDVLLSFGEEGEEEEEEEERSTARTQGNDASDTADSCSSRLRKSRLALSSSSSSSHKSSGSERKRQKMKKMMKSLRGIVPGGNRMNTVAVLDEAVKYLKSLKVEVQKIGVGNLKN